MYNLCRCCLVRAILCTAAQLCALAAQTSSAASIAGHVQDEKGAPVPAIVTAFAGTFVQRAPQPWTGAFSSNP